MEHTPQTPYKFSSEELRVLQQCNSESFLHRSVPFSTLFGVAAYYGVKGGLLQPNSRYGAIPKVVGSVLLGYILGKISYQGKCAEKLMALPDSKLGAMLRNRRRRGGYQESLGMDGPGMNVSGVSESETFTDVPPRHIPTSDHMNIDVDRPLSAGLDDSFRPSVDDSHLDFYDQSLPPASSRTTTYDELRRKNREEYELKRTKPFRGVLTPDEVPGALKSKETKMETSPSPSAPPIWNKATNQYGDIWEK